MLKNNKGVTMISLVVTVILLSLLAGVSLNAGFTTINDVRRGRILSSMSLVQAKAEILYEDYCFHNNDETYLVGLGSYKIDSSTYKLENIELSQEEIKAIAENAGVALSDVLNWKWYKWNRAVLEAQGLDKNMLSETEYFYINFENAEIIYSMGTSGDNGRYFYSMTGLSEM